MKGLPQEGHVGPINDSKSLAFSGETVVGSVLFRTALTMWTARDLGGPRVPGGSLREVRSPDTSLYHGASGDQMHYCVSKDNEIQIVTLSHQPADLVTIKKESLMRYCLEVSRH